MGTIIVRNITKDDNERVAMIIKNVLEDFNVPKTGSAYADDSLKDMYSTYNKPNTIYLVAEENGMVMGCAGIAKLDNYEGNVCELQKMYILKEGRSKGIGKKLMEECLAYAKDFGYDACYIETMPNMDVAQKMYKKYGFEYLSERMGDTGHSACPVWMLKKL
ncbi:GNAT family N-acetyltransferase [Leptobacterium sp. I13]|uniref:GNAT family N-acetyltransferase n=1 Tax=Leptobacterium meishanense TaxID=3128904 RepID=UPI0030EC6857